MIYLGIDPGVSGGISIINGSKVMAFPMPVSETDLWNLIHEYGTPSIRHPKNGPTSYAVMEKVGGYIPNTDPKYSTYQPGHYMFNFGRMYGLCWMALIAAGIPFDLVHPKTWQKEFKMKRNAGETKIKWKGRLKGLAQRLFPQARATLATADSLLLAEYARRTRR